MTDKERKRAPFLRPKKWFKAKDWSYTRPQKIFAMTTSNGKMFACLIPKPFDKYQWARIVTTKLGPFLKRAFPNRRTFKLLVDSEQLLHSPPAKAAYRQVGIEILSGWPKYSPELNPQENVWPIAERILRKKEGNGGESFEQFQKWVLESVRAYPGKKNLVGAMVNKVEECLETHGQYISS